MTTYEAIIVGLQSILAFIGVVSLIKDIVREKKKVTVHRPDKG